MDIGGEFHFRLCKKTSTKISSPLCFFFGPLTLSAYWIGTNLGYVITVLPEHDCYETAENSNSELREPMDWGELQVRHAANWGGRLFCEVWGGTNYQIEHHLFPGVHSYYLPLISPIVKQTAKEFGIPYVHHESSKQAFQSVWKQVVYSNKNFV